MMKLIGGIIKINRCQANLSIKAVAQELNLSESYISRVERNKEVLSLENTKKIFAFLGIDYSKEDIDEQFEKDFYVFYKDIFFMNDYEKSYHTILSYQDCIKSTYSYIKFLLAKMIYRGMTKQKDKPRDYDYIKEYFIYLEEYQKQIYYDYMGVFSKMQNKTYDAINYYNYALQYKGIDESKAMLSYHASMDLKRNGDIQKAIESAIIARDIFAQTINLKRLTMVSAHLATLYSMNGDSQKAENTFLNCLNGFELLGIKSQRDILYNNMIWHLVRNHYYEKIINMEQKVLTEIQNDHRIFFYLSYAYYKMNDEKKALEYIKFARKNMFNPTLYMKSMIDAFYVYLSNAGNERKEKHLLNAHQKACQSEDIDLVIFTEELLKDFYQETDQKEKYYQSVENLMNYYKNRSL